MTDADHPASPAPVEELFLDDVSGASVWLTEAGLRIGRDQAQSRLIPWEDVEVVGVSRLVPALGWSPYVAPAKAIMMTPVFCCTVVARAGPVANVLSITLDEDGRLVDRASSYRAFVLALHRLLAKARTPVVYLAGIPDQGLINYRCWMIATGVVAALLLAPPPFGAGVGPWAAALVLGAAGKFLYSLVAAAAPARQFRRYDPAAIPPRFMPAD